MCIEFTHTHNMKTYFIGVFIIIIVSFVLLFSYCYFFIINSLSFPSGSSFRFAFFNMKEVFSIVFL